MYTFNRLKKVIITYLIVAIICICFMQIYYHFAHGLTSKYMTFMFLIPLIAGFVMTVVLAIIKKPIRITFNLYNASIAAFTVYATILGIFEMAETKSDYIVIYPVMGTILLLLAIIAFTYEIRLKTNSVES